MASGCFQCEFLSIQEVVEHFHSPNGSKCLPFQILVVLLSFSQRPGSKANHLSFQDYACSKPFLGSIHLEGCFCIDIKVWKSPHVGNFHFQLVKVLTVFLLWFLVNGLARYAKLVFPLIMHGSSCWFSCFLFCLVRSVR